MKLYDTKQYEQAIKHFEEALKGYFQADVECRVMCWGPQKFNEYEYVDHKATWYEVIAGKTLCNHHCMRPLRISDTTGYLDFLRSKRKYAM